MLVERHISGHGAEPATLSPIEARIVRLAASDGERPGCATVAGQRVQASFDRLVGRRTPRSLADPRLEALRNQAIAFRRGQTALQPHFLAAGYSEAHGPEIGRIVRTAARRRSPTARRDRAAYAGGISLAIGSMFAFVSMTADLLVHP